MKPLIIAHRGGAALAPENSIEAFRNAIKLQANMIEFDIRKTKDNVLVIHHDADIQGKIISEHIYKELLKHVDEKHALEKLETVLNLTKGKILLNVELKESGYEKDILVILLKYFSPNDFVITSFIDESITTVKSLHPEIKAGLLLGEKYPKHGVWTRFSELIPFFRVKKCHADFIAPNYQFLDIGLLWLAGILHIPIFVWIVDDVLRLKRYLHDARIAGIITDVPDIALKLIKINNT